MKLPKTHNKYKFNKVAEELHESATSLALEYANSYEIDEICRANLLLIKIIHAKIMHLELALEEIMKLSEEQK